MATSITTIQNTDLITNSRADINNNFDSLLVNKIETDTLVTDSTFASASDSTIASSLATKLYVDAGGNVNAGETTKGIVEEATDAEVTAGTATGGSGAKLFVSPAKLATRLSAVPSVTLFQQAIPCLTVATAYWKGFTASSDGSVFFIARGNAPTVLYRYQRDSVTNMYVETHSVSASAGGSQTGDGLTIIGSYLYHFTKDVGAVKCYRYNIADITGATLMTVPAVGSSANTNCRSWTDGTDLYIVESESQTTSRKWTLSGTTFSASSTATVTTGIFVNATSGSMWDGTSAWIVDNSISATAVTLRKLTSIDGSAYTTTTSKLATIGGADAGALAIPIGTTAMYIGKISNNFNATVDVGSTINLFPITRP